MGGQWEFFVKAFKWIKPEDSENLTKIPKHDKRTSLITLTHLARGQINAEHQVISGGIAIRYEMQRINRFA